MKNFVKDSDLKLVKLERMGGASEIVAMILAEHFAWLPLIGTPLEI